jgi:two-component system KDP operon response regulator KdpE
MKILIIGENKTILSDITLCLNMRYPDSVLFHSNNASVGIGMIELESPDLLITDFPLTDMDSMEYIGKIREFSDIPMIIVGPEPREAEKARALEAGADEYIHKPLNSIEFLATTNALLRRTKGIGMQSQMIVSIEKDFTVNLNTHEISRSGKKIQLTPMEFKLLSVLVRNRGQILNHRVLLERAWGSNYVDDLDLLKKEIYRLRSKLEAEPHCPKYILCERGFGYRFVIPA